MKISKKFKYAEQFPNRGTWDVVNPSYLTIGGSGVVGTFGAESPMSNYENSESPSSEMGETPSQEAAEGASMSSGAGAAAGAGITGAGSGVA